MDRGPRFAALSARLSGLDRLASYVADGAFEGGGEARQSLQRQHGNRASGSGEGGSAHRSAYAHHGDGVRQPNTYTPDQLMTTDGFGPFFMEPVVQPPHAHEDYNPMSSIFDHSAEEEEMEIHLQRGWQDMNQHPLGRSFLPRNKFVHTELPRHIREDPDLEGQRWTQAATSAAGYGSARSGGGEARRLRPINLTSAPSAGATSAAASQSHETAQNQQQQHQYQQPSPLARHQTRETADEEMLEQIVGRLKHEYAHKMAEEQYITNRLVELGINPSLRSGANTRRRPSVQQQQRPAQTSIQAPGLERLFNPLSLRHAATSPMHAEGEAAAAAPGHVRTPSGAVLYSDAEISEMEKIHEEMGKLLREQQQLQALHRPREGGASKLKVDSRQLMERAVSKQQSGEKEAAKPADESEGPRSLELLVAKAEKGEPITRRKIKPTFVGPRESVVRAMTDVLGAQRSSYTAQHSGAATPQYSIASPRPATLSAPLGMEMDAPLPSAAAVPSPELPARETQLEEKVENKKEAKAETKKEEAKAETKKEAVKEVKKEAVKETKKEAAKETKKEVKKETKKAVPHGKDEPVAVPAQSELPSNEELLAKIHGILGPLSSKPICTKRAANESAEHDDDVIITLNDERQGQQKEGGKSKAGALVLNVAAKEYTPPIPAPLPPNAGSAAIEIRAPPASKRAAAAAAKRAAPKKAAAATKAIGQPSDGAESSETVQPAKERPLAPGKIAPAPPSDDARRLEQREKQLGFGYATEEYKLFASMIPKNARSARDPMSPNPRQDCSKRSWDGQVREWRRALHDWKAPTSKAESLKTEAELADAAPDATSQSDAKAQEAAGLSPSGRAFPDVVAVGDLSPAAVKAAKKLLAEGAVRAKALKGVREETEEELEEGQIPESPRPTRGKEARKPRLDANGDVQAGGQAGMEKARAKLSGGASFRDALMTK